VRARPAGYSRDQKRGTPQIIYGLLCDKPGRPIAVKVFSGELHDDTTLPSQIAKLKPRFGLHWVDVVSDRGTVTEANLELLPAQGTGWITALKAPQIGKLVNDGALQLLLFDQHNWPKSPPRSIPASGWLCAATRWWRPTAHVSAKNCFKRPSVACGRSPRASHAARLAAPAASGWPWAPRSRATGSRRTSRSRSPTPPSPMSATPSGSRQRPRSTGSTCSAPASPTATWTAARWCAPTSSSSRSSAPSEGSQDQSFRSA
jgi:hypothetical protein